MRWNGSITWQHCQSKPMSERSLKFPTDLYKLAMIQVSWKERTKSTMITKNCISKVGLSRFPNNAHAPILLTKGDISQENTKISQEKLSFSPYFIFKLTPLLSIKKCTINWFYFIHSIFSNKNFLFVHAIRVKIAGPASSVVEHSLRNSFRSQGDHS